VSAAVDPNQDPRVVRIQEIKARYEEELLAKANVIVVGVGLRRKSGVTTEEPVLVVLVSRKVPKAQLAEGDFVPDWIEDVPVDVQEIGFIRSHDDGSPAITSD
jgi:hypothetical protein